MSTASKGRAREKAAIAILESQGWLCSQAGKEVMRLRDGRTLTRQHDFFGCADIVAVLAGVTLFVQVGTLEHRAQKQRKMEPLVKAGRVGQRRSGVMCQVWSFVPGRRPNGQRFRVRGWNGLEWGDYEDQVCLPAATAGSRVARASKLSQPGAREQKDIGKSASSRPEVTHGGLEGVANGR